MRPARLGLIAGLAAFLVAELGWLAGVDARLYDLGIRTRNPLPRPGNVVLVQIDDFSIAELGRWPWPWSQHARLVRTLDEQYQPAAIVFDLLFAEVDPTDADHEFAQAIQEAGNVYLAAFLTSDDWSGEQEAETDIPWLVAEYVGPTQLSGNRYSTARPPVAELAVAAAGVGAVNIVPELDGSVRSIPIVLDYDGVPYASLSAAVLNAVVNAEGNPVRVDPGRAVHFGDYAVPISAAGETLVSYGTSPSGGTGGAFERYRYERVLNGRVPAEALRDKIVLVGFGGVGMADVHPTPLSPAELGVDVTAYALNGMLAGSFLRLSGWPVPLALSLIVGAIVALFVWILSPARALALMLLTVVGAILFAELILWVKGLWVGGAAPVAAALFAYGLTLAQRYRASERESLRVQASVETLAHATRVIGSVRLKHEMLAEIRSQVRDVMGARWVNLYLLDEQRERLNLSSPPESEMQPVSYALGEGTVGWVARHNNLHLVQDVQGSPALRDELTHAVRHPAGSVMYAPMRHRDHVAGVIEVVRSVGEPPFAQAHLAILEAVAGEVAVALENVNLYEQLSGKVEIANRKLLAAYAELRQERDRVAAMVSNMADGVLLTDSARRILFINPAAAEMFGLDPAEVANRPVSQVLPHEELLEQLEDGALEETARIPRIRLEQPKRLVLSPRTVLLSDQDGRRTGAITVLSDITLLEELSQMKTEFVSLVSHELRTPLTSIMGFAQTLRGMPEKIDEEERAEFLGIIEQESNRLLVMINDLLDISRMEAGRTLSVDYKDVDLRPLAEHVVRFQRVTTTSHSFLFEFPADGLAVEADRDKVEQIVTNLVSNAIKYSPKGGEVVIGAREEGEEVVVYVRDQGLGMGSEEIGQLFQRYQRVDRDAIKGIRGTGLGLYLVRGLVEVHGGRVWAESQPGEGSTFYFSLPKHRAEEKIAV